MSRLHRRIRPAGAAPAVPDCSAAKTFYDWNGDGCGDIRGTTERIEYLSDLGVTCLWLMPFYPTARARTTATTSPTW